MTGATLATPAGTRLKGYNSPAQIADLLEVPFRVADALKAQGAVLYGRSDCAWTTRQRAVLGLAMERVPYVDCQKAAAECTKAGVQAYPSWKVGSHPPIAGFRPLPELSALATADAATLDQAAARSLQSLSDAKSGRK